ncbi:MAG: hypothetical protein FJY54_00890 [Betaproteobacteria bacterium]|nr:hypothetical protein [Betaproteobacteria bacterium]
MIAITAIVVVNAWTLPLAVSGFMAGAREGAGFVGEGGVFGGVSLLLSAALLDVSIASALLVFGLARLNAPGPLTPRQAAIVARSGALALGAPFLIGYLLSGRVFWVVLSLLAFLVGWGGLRAVFWVFSRFVRSSRIG